MADQSLLATMTGEHFQPVRLHYKVWNHPGLLRAFEKLRCLDYDATQKRWVWLYAHEAKKLRFQRSYAQFPKELHPIVIGAFFLRTKETSSSISAPASAPSWRFRFLTRICPGDSSNWRTPRS